MEPTRILLSGSAGFVGSHVLRQLLTHTTATVACPVTFRHKGVPARIAALLRERPAWTGRIDVVLCDLSAPVDDVTARRFGPVDAILNCASESHVDRSISAPGPFIRNNVDLMVNVLEYAIRARPGMVLQMSTDEVYGPAYGEYRHREWDSVIPSNPYSASKAAQEAIAVSYWRTFGLPVVITNTMNIIAPGQDREKFVPTVIRKVLAGEDVLIHASPDGVPGSRHWLDAADLADAWLFLLRHHAPALYPDAVLPSRFHVVGQELSNLDMAQRIADLLGKPLKYQLLSFHASRPGHDLRYALDGTRLASEGWTPGTDLDATLRRIVDWYLAHPEWLV